MTTYSESGHIALSPDGSLVHYRHGTPTLHPSKQSSTSLERHLRQKGESQCHSLPRLSIVPPCSRSSSADKLTITSNRRYNPTLSHGDESMTVMLSAFYAKLLIVLGIALPVTSTIQNQLYPTIVTDIFNIYTYVVSILFLAYTFYQLRLARREKKNNGNVKRIRYGSFYLHMGIAGFSVGSIIYSCLQLGGYFDLSGDCKLPIVIVKPALRIVFMLTQTVFIFSYSDVLEPMRGIVLDRLGLMHVLATNVCEWLNVIIQETRDDILSVAYNKPSVIRYANLTSVPINSTTALFNNLTDLELSYTFDKKNWTCNVTDMITPLIRNVNPYLRPCGVEYSLLCAVIIGVIWNDVCTVPGLRKSRNNNKVLNEKKCCGRLKSNKHFSVDCGNAHKGLFMGMAVLAGTIVSLMLFNGMFHNNRYMETALLQVNIWETILYILMTVGSAACIHRMRRLELRKAVNAMPLEHALLLVTQCGVYLYYLFQIIGATFLIQRYPESRRATRIISPLCAIIQSSCQTLLVLDAWSRRCSAPMLKARPGRQLVTFLMVGNVAMWLLNRVKNSRAEFHPLQMEFYGIWAWTLITHVSVPLLVCYRFQATVCFYEIWKNSYKKDKDINDIELEELSHST